MTKSSRFLARIGVRRIGGTSRLREGAGFRWRRSRRPTRSCGLARLCPIGEDLGHPHERELLPVPALSARVLPAALLEGNDLRPTPLLQNFGSDASAGDSWRAEHDIV